MNIQKIGFLSALVLILIGVAFSGCLEPAKPVSKLGNHFSTGDVDAIAFAAPTPGNASFLKVRFIGANISITAANVTNVSNATISIYYPNMTLLNSTVFIHDAGLTDNITAFANFSVPADGRYFLNATTIDTDAFIGNATLRVITVDTAAPVTAFLAPTIPDGSWTKNFTVNITANDTNLKNCILTIGFVNGTVGNYSATSSARNNCYVSIATIVDGQVNFTITANDSANNQLMNTSLHFFNIINKAGPVAFAAPGITNGTRFASYVVALNLTFFSLNISNATIYVTNATNSFIVNTTQANFTNPPGGNNSFLFNVPIPTMGEYDVNATYWDAAGNVNSTPAIAIVGYSIFNWSIDVLKGSTWINTAFNQSAKLSFLYCPAANGTVCAATGQQANFPVLRFNNQGTTNGTQLVMKINANSTSEDLYCGTTGVFASATRLTDGNQTIAASIGPSNQTGIWCWTAAYNATRNLLNLTVFGQ